MKAKPKQGRQTFNHPAALYVRKPTRQEASKHAQRSAPKTLDDLAVIIGSIRPGTPGRWVLENAHRPQRDKLLSMMAECLIITLRWEETE